MKVKMMSYNYFASLYDCLTSNVDYKVRSEYISDFFVDNSIPFGANILDLACGTCSISIPLAKKGYNITGIDASQQMLEIASNKAFDSGCNLSLLCSKMQDFDINDQFEVCICTLDSINHLENEKDVLNTFKNVYNCLKQDGLFIFDVNTIYKHNYVLADNTFVFEDDDYYLVWDNEKLDNNKIRILLDMFIYNGSSYDRYSEEFIEKAYSIECLNKLLIESKFQILGVYEELTKNKPKENTQRVFFVCKKVI